LTLLLPFVRLRRALSKMRLGARGWRNVREVQIQLPLSGPRLTRLTCPPSPAHLFDSAGKVKYTYTAAGQLLTEIGPISGMAEHTERGRPLC
jgi:hypothetical protein